MSEQQERQLIHEQFNRIPVPKDAVYAAIGRGVESAPRRHPLRNSLLALAATLLLGTAGVATLNPAVGQAISNVTWLSGFYLFNGRRDNFHNFHVNGKVKGLDETVTSHGLTVHLVEAYYSGNTIGVTGEVTGMNQKQLNLNGEDEFAFALKPTKAPHFSNSSYDFQQTKTGYRFSLVFRANGKIAPNQVTLPVAFDNLGGVAGAWQFELHMNKTH